MMPANRDRNNTQYLCGRRCMTCAKSSVSIKRSSLTAPTHLTSCTCDSTEMLFQLLFFIARQQTGAPLAILISRSGISLLLRVSYEPNPNGPYGNPRVTPSTRVLNVSWVRKMRFSTEIAVFLANCTRYTYSYCGSLRRGHMFWIRQIKQTDPITPNDLQMLGLEGGPNFWRETPMYQYTV